MKLIGTIIILAGLVAQTAMANNIHLQQASGKTKLTAEACSKKAEFSFSQLNLSSIKTTVNLSDNKIVSNPSESTPRTTNAKDSERAYSISCRVFGSEIVIFTIAGKNSDHMKKIWASFYSN